MSAIFRAIRPDELDECLDLWGNVFAVGRDYFPPYFYGDPWFKHAYTRVCEADGKLVSAVQVCERRVRVGDGELIMGGIGNVATYPEYRGRGHSQQLLSDAAVTMREHRIDFSVLFTGIMPFYEKALWRSVPQRMFAGKIKRDLPEADGRYTSRNVDWTADMPVIQEICEAFDKGRALTTVRTPEYWTGYLAARFGAPEFTLVAESAGKPVGYLFYGSNTPNCWLKEIGYLSGHEACADTLMREVAVRARDAKCAEFFANLPHEPAILAAFKRVADDFEPREPMGGMFRITNMESLSERLLPELNRRAREYNVPDAEISLDTELGYLSFTISRGQAALGARNPIRVPVSQLEFFCLVFGIKSVEELGMSLPDEARETISALFPPQKPVFWLADHF